MKIFIAPASPKTAVAAIRTLLASTATAAHGPLEVIGVYRDTKRAPVEFTNDSRFRAIKGNLNDPSSLDFVGADAVLTITPPITAPELSLTEEAEKISRGVKEAVEKAGCVKKLVLISSIGAHLTEGIVSLSVAIMMPIN